MAVPSRLHLNAHLIPKNPRHEIETNPQCTAHCHSFLSDPYLDFGSGKAKQDIEPHVVGRNLLELTSVQPVSSFELMPLETPVQSSLVKRVQKPLRMTNEAGSLNVPAEHGLLGLLPPWSKNPQLYELVSCGASRRRPMQASFGICSPVPSKAY